MKVAEMYVRRTIGSRGLPTVEAGAAPNEGAPGWSERLAKYNELLCIEEELARAGN